MSNLSLSAYLADLAVEELEIRTINNEVIQQQETISDALVTSLYVDNIQDVVSESYVSKTELSKTTMHCINLAVENICHNLGANTSKYIRTLSVESYTSDSYKTVALEDINIFIKDLWVKIKDSVNNLWNKVNEFWKNHFSALNKIKVALESALQDVNDKYQKTEASVSNKEDSMILNSFNDGGDVDQRALETFILAHYHSFNTVDEIIKHTKHFNHFVKNLTQNDFDSDINYILDNLSKNFVGRIFKLGTDKAPMVTGEYITIEYVKPENNNDLDLIHSVEKIEPNQNRKIYIVSKSHLKTLILKTLDIIKETIKYKDIQTTLQKEFNQLTSIYDGHIERNGLIMDYDHINNKNTVLLKNYKKTIRLIYRINSSMPKILGAVITSNVKLARSVVNYTHFCLTH